MSGGSKKVTVGYWYRLLFQWGLCKGPIDALLEFRAGDRVAWQGTLSSSGQLSISKEDLWGGKSQEGGISGAMDVLFGRADQGKNDYLISQLGDSLGAERGKCTVVWRGGRWGAMNPYPKTPAFKVRRIKQGWDNDVCWYPETAQVTVDSQILDVDTSLYIALDISGSMAGSRLSVLQTAMTMVLGDLSDWLSGAESEISIKLVAFSGSSSTITRTISADDSDFADKFGDLLDFINGLTASGSTDALAAYEPAVGFFNHTPRNNVLVCVSDGAMDSVSEAQSVMWDMLDKTTGYFNEADGTAVSMYGIGVEVEGSLASFDNSGDPVTVLSGTNAGELSETILNALKKGNPIYGMNPAHILYDSLTAQDMQGEPIGMINDESFRAAADRFYAERLGLCTTFDGEAEDIEAFQQRICDAAGACLTQSRVDGQYYLDLIRAVEDTESLHLISSDDVIDFEQALTNVAENTNQIIVEWYDPELKQDRTTAPYQALGAIQAAGGIISETRTYKEIPAESLALRIAARDLQASATPLSKFTLTTNRRAWKLRPGQYFRLQLPEEGIADMLCLVGDIDTGTLLDGRIQITAVQDVFSMPDTVYIQPESGNVQPDDRIPVASANQRLIEAPYVELVVSLSNADLAALPNEAGALMAMATEPSAGLDYALYTAGDGEDLTDNGMGNWCPSALINEAAGYLDTEFTLSGSSNLADVELGTWALWEDEIVRVDAIDSSSGTLTLGRGCADSVPAPHAALSRIWFCGDDGATDEREYVDGETVTAKLLTRTSSALQSLDSASALTVEMNQRHYRPYPPGNFQINGQSYPDTALGEVALSWAHRDRLLQADQLLDTSMGSVGPEPETTYSIRLSRVDNQAVLAEQDAIAENNTNVSISYTGSVNIELWAERGGLESWQRHSHTLMLTATVKMRAKVSIPSPSEELEGFPIYIDLGTLPAEFWSNRPFKDGRDIRVKNANDEDIPFHLVRINPVHKNGSLFVKHTLSVASITDIYVHWGNSALSAVDESAAVWSDYHRVFLFNIEQKDYAGSGNPAGAYARNKRFGLVSQSPLITAHQGVCSDGVYYYVVDTNAIEKYDLSWNLIATNNNPVGDIGNGVNHCGDPDVHNGVLYIPAENYVNSSNFSNQRIAQFNASDLSFISSVSVATQGTEVSSIAVDVDDNCLLVSNYTSGAFSLQKYSLSDLSFIETLSGNSTATYVQGITKFRGRMYCNSDGLDWTYMLSGDGGYTSATRMWTDIPDSASSRGGNYEGLGSTDEALLVLRDDGSSSQVYVLEPLNVEAGGGMDIIQSPEGISRFESGNLTDFSTFTMGATVIPDALGSANQAVLSLSANTSDNNNRVTMLYRYQTGKFGLWDATNLWLDASSTPSAGNKYRLHARYNGTSSRALFVNGVKEGSSGSISAAPSGKTRLFIGAEDTSYSQVYDGKIGYVYIKAEALSDAWIAAEVSNLNNPAGFYSVGITEIVSST